MRIRLLVLLLVLLAACTNNNSIPADIIPVPKMQTILWQLMQSDEFVNKQLVKDSLKKASVEKMKIYQQVFDLNKTSLAEFKKSYQYYIEHPGVAKKMFDSISAIAGRQRADMYKSQPIIKPTAAPIIQVPGHDSLGHPPGLLKRHRDSLQQVLHNRKLRLHTKKAIS